MWVAGIQTQTLVLTRQAPCPPSHFPSPDKVFSQNFLWIFQHKSKKSHGNHMGPPQAEGGRVFPESSPALQSAGSWVHYALQVLCALIYFILLQIHFSWWWISHHGEFPITKPQLHSLWALSCGLMFKCMPEDSTFQDTEKACLINTWKKWTRGWAEKPCLWNVAHCLSWSVMTKVMQSGTASVASGTWVLQTWWQARSNDSHVYLAHHQIPSAMKHRSHEWMIARISTHLKTQVGI